MIKKLLPTQACPSILIGNDSANLNLIQNFLGKSGRLLFKTPGFTGQVSEGIGGSIPKVSHMLICGSNDRTVPKAGADIVKKVVAAYGAETSIKVVISGYGGGHPVTQFDPKISADTSEAAVFNDVFLKELGEYAKHCQITLDPNAKTSKENIQNAAKVFGPDNPTEIVLVQSASPLIKNGWLSIKEADTIGNKLYSIYLVPGETVSSKSASIDGKALNYELIYAFRELITLMDWLNRPNDEFFSHLYEIPQEVVDVVYQYLEKFGKIDGYDQTAPDASEWRNSPEYWKKLNTHVRGIFNAIADWHNI